MFKLIARLGYTVLVFVEAIIIVRIAVSMFNINTANRIVSWIISTSEIFINPFKGILANEYLRVLGFNLELTSVAALFFYMILAFVTIEIVKAFSSD